MPLTLIFDSPLPIRSTIVNLVLALFAAHSSAVLAQLIPQGFALARAVSRQSCALALGFWVLVHFMVPFVDRLIRVVLAPCDGSVAAHRLPSLAACLTLDTSSRCFAF